MGSRERNDVGSIALDRSSHPHHHHHFRLFSAASFGRRLLATLSCGGGRKKPTSKSDPIIAKDNGVGSSGRSGSGKLVDLLNLKRENNGTEEVQRKKEERLEELRNAVRLVQSEVVEERENGAKLIRGLARDDGEARTNLALMGAIPPLVAMIAIDDAGDESSSQIEAMYALLNLGIGNDL